MFHCSSLIWWYVELWLWIDDPVIAWLQYNIHLGMPVMYNNDDRHIYIPKTFQNGKRKHKQIVMNTVSSCSFDFCTTFCRL